MGNTQAFHFDDRCRTLPETIVAGEAEFSLKVGSRRRSGIIAFPSTITTDQERPRPILFCFHGAGGNATQMATYTQLSSLANAEDFIVVFPNGTGKRSECQKRFLTWNAGYGARGAAADVDDVEFVKVMLDQFELHFPVDATKIYVTGLSNGAALCHKLASDPRTSPRIAAIASVAGHGRYDTYPFQPRHPTPVLHIHSKDDPIAPYNGGAGTKSWLIKNPPHHDSVTNFLSRWILFNNNVDDQLVHAVPEPYTRAPHREVIIDGIKHTADFLAWPSSQSQPNVEHIVLTGAGHQWPSANKATLGRCMTATVGPPTTVIDANAEIWSFFKRCGNLRKDEEKDAPSTTSNKLDAVTQGCDAPPAYNQLAA